VTYSVIYLTNIKIFIKINVLFIIIKSAYVDSSNKKVTVHNLNGTFRSFDFHKTTSLNTL